MAPAGFISLFFVLAIAFAAPADLYAAFQPAPGTFPVGSPTLPRADSSRYETLESRLAAATQSALEERYPEYATRLRVRVLRTSLDDAPTEWGIRLLRSEIPRAHTRIDVMQRDGGAERKLGWALLYVEHYDTLAVPTRAIARGESLGEDDVNFVLVETTRFHGQPVPASRIRTMIAASGAIAERPLAAGRPLRKGDVRAPWAVNTGDAVKLSYQRPGLTLTLIARAREPGSIDDAIRVYCADTGATYRARLVGEGEAVWLETL